MNTFEQNHATKGKHTTTKIKPADSLDDELNSGAVLLGSHAEKNNLITIATSAPTEPLPELGDEDIRYREEREKIVTRAVSQSLAAATALHEIKIYRDGLLWKKEFRTFEDYCRKHWDYQKSQAYRHIRAGAFVAKLAENHSPFGENSKITESHLRPVLDKVPEELQIECWRAITASTPESSKLTAGTITEQVKKFLSEKGLPPKGKKPGKPNDREIALRDMAKFRASLSKLNPPERFESLLLEFSDFINRESDDAVPVEATEIIACNIMQQNDPTPHESDRVASTCDKQVDDQVNPNTKSGITVEIVAAAMDAVAPPHEQSMDTATAKLEKETPVYQRNLVITATTESESKQDKQDTAAFMSAQLFHDVLHPGEDYATWLSETAESHPADIRIPNDGGAARISLVRARHLAFHSMKSTSKNTLDLIHEAQHSRNGNPGKTAEALFQQHALAANESDTAETPE